MSEVYWPERLVTGSSARGTDGLTAAEHDVLHLLREATRAMTPAEIAGALGIEGATARKRLQRMVQRGMVETRRGWYGVPGR